MGRPSVTPFFDLAHDLAAMHQPPPNVIRARHLDKAVEALADNLSEADAARYGLDGIAPEKFDAALRRKLLNDARIVVASRNPQLRANAQSRVIAQIVGMERAAYDLRGELFTVDEEQRIAQIAYDALARIESELLREYQNDAQVNR